MATIYRFITEQKIIQESGRKQSEPTTNKKTTAKKGKAVSFLGGSKGGVEHNRRMRAINPILNRMTHGYYEKGMRVGRAGVGLVKGLNDVGLKALFGVGATILVSFAIQTALKIQRIQRDRADKNNSQDYRALENGFSSIHGDFNITRNYWDGRINYNDNK